MGHQIPGEDHVEPHAHGDQGVEDPEAHQEVLARGQGALQGPEGAPHGEEEVSQGGDRPAHPQEEEGEKPEEEGEPHGPLSPKAQGPPPEAHQAVRAKAARRK